ncbi:hypothetical protein CSB11_00720, partial [Candidatus Campbellbacteria bacterium]
DVNGDGLPDIIKWRHGYENNYFSTDGINQVYINNGNGFTKISKIKNQQQGETEFEYSHARMQDDSNKVPFPLEIVEKITTNDKNGNVAETEYEYKDASYYYGGPFDKKFAGFGGISKTNPNGSLEKIKFHQANGQQGSEPVDSYSKIGKVYQTSLKDQSGNLYTKTYTNYTENNLGNNSNSVLLDSEVSEQYDGTSSHTDFATKYLYDQYGNVTEQTNFGLVNSNSNGSFTDTQNDKRVVEYEYLNDTSKYIVSLPTKEVLKNKDDQKEKETKYTYDQNGNLTKQSNWISGNEYADTSYTYNSVGLPTEQTDPLGNITKYTYNNLKLYPATITNALNQKTRYLYNLYTGNYTKVTDPNENTTLYKYDGLNRLTRVSKTFANGNTVYNKKVEYNTQVFPNYTKQTLYRSGTNKQNIYTYFDGFGRSIQTKSETQNGYATQDKVYNQMGLLQKQTLPYQTSSDAFTSPTSNSALYNTFEYDEMGRITKTENVKGQSTKTYNGLETEIVDAENNKKEFTKDAFGNLTLVKEYNGNDIYQTHYNYNTQNKLTKIIDAENNTRNITYDGLGRRTSFEDLHKQTDSQFGVWNYTYNKQNLISQTDPNGNQVSYTYDSLNRVLTENSNTTPQTDVTYTYDNCTYGTGKLCSVTTPNYSQNLTYLKQGLVDTENTIIDGVSYTTDFDYNRQGQVTKVTNPNTLITENKYNKQGLVKEIKQDGQKVVEYEYEVNGKVKKEEYQNGVETNYTYNPNKLYELTNKTTVLNSQNVQDLSYQYDNVGNILQITDASNGDTFKTQSFEYDNLYRLTKATVTNTQNNTDYTRIYNYSPIGNITDFNGANYTYTDNGYNNPNSVTQIEQNTYTYDNNGNLTSDGTWTHTWNYNNTLKSSTNGSSVSNYTYNQKGDRIKLQEGTDVTIYPSQYYEVENGKAKVNIQKDGKTVVTKSVNGAENKTEYIHTDHLGGTHIITDNNSNIVKTKDYFPFGDIRIDTGTSTEDNSFTGYEHDSQTGLDYAEARYYNSKIGKFISQDSAVNSLGLNNKEQTQLLTDPQQLNTYSYVRNNPLNNIDPTGETLEAGYFNILKTSFNGYQNLYYILTGDYQEAEQARDQARLNAQASVTEFQNAVTTEKVETALTVGGGVALKGIGVLAKGSALGKRSHYGNDIVKKIIKNLDKGGHSRNHISEFRNLGIKNKEQLYNHAKFVEKNFDLKYTVKNNSKLYYHEKTNSLLIKDFTGSKNGGTFFRPRDGKDYLKVKIKKKDS